MWKVGVFLLLLGTGCSATSDNLAVVASSAGSVGLGNQRLLVALVDPDDSTYLAAPDLAIQFELTPPGGASFTVPAEFVWAVENSRGLYVAEVDFPDSGTWTVALKPEGSKPTKPSPFEVLADLTMVEVGEPAPRSKTRTIRDGELSEITSDPDPDLDFYQMTVEQAVTTGRPCVIVFSTPAFCSSATCGPTLDRVKVVKQNHPNANFVHVEVYENLDATNFDDLVLVPAIEEWGLPSEPWVFVVDGNGVVAARFEGAFTDADVETALAAVGG